MIEKDYYDVYVDKIDWEEQVVEYKDCWETRETTNYGWGSIEQYMIGRMLELFFAEIRCILLFGENEYLKNETSL